MISDSSVAAGPKKEETLASCEVDEVGAGRRSRQNAPTRMAAAVGHRELGRGALGQTRRASTPAGDERLGRVNSGVAGGNLGHLTLHR